jgi:hypothetical protein
MGLAGAGRDAYAGLPRSGLASTLPLPILLPSPDSIPLEATRSFPQLRLQRLGGGTRRFCLLYEEEGFGEKRRKWKWERGRQPSPPLHLLCKPSRRVARFAGFERAAPTSPGRVTRQNFIFAPGYFTAVAGHLAHEPLRRRMATWKQMKEEPRSARAGAASIEAWRRTATH